MAKNPPTEKNSTDFESKIEEIKQGYKDAFESAETEQVLRERNAKILGPNGELTSLLKWMPQIPKEDRKHLGQLANETKREIESAFEERLLSQKAEARRKELEGPAIDFSLPGKNVLVGKLHPITRVMNELIDVFSSLGFQVAQGPEVEHYENNFTKLGFPPDHPATDMQDSFFIHRNDGNQDRDVMLRTHTSTVQIRQMLSGKPPLAFVSPGKVYRKDDDATHSPMFFQLEGFLVDKNVSIADLKGVLTLFLQRTFGSNIPIRFRPSYFPFVEPGGEVDIGCMICRRWDEKSSDQGHCRVCKDTGWLEILGCGMIHPTVFEHVGYDPSEWSGFAFGLGIDRIAMLKYAIPNIRLLYENDIRFLSQL